MPNNILPINSDVPDITSIPDVRATPADMGAQDGAALSNLGDAAARAAVAMKEYQDRSDGIDGQLSLAQLHQNTTAARIAMQNSPDAGTPAAMERFQARYQDMYQKAYDALPNNTRVQNAFQVGAADMFTGQVDSAMQSQAAQAAALQVQKAKTELATYVNTIQTDASQYQTAVKGGDALIDGLQLPPDKTGQLRQNFHDAAIAGRFDALFRAAKTPDAVAGIMKDLESGDWKNTMTPAKFNDMLRLGTAAQKSAQKVVNEQATAAVSSVEDRIKGGALIDPAEMAAIGGAVKQSGNPLLVDKFVRLQVQNDTSQHVRGMSSAAIGQYVASNTGAAPMAPSTTTARMQDGFAYLKSKYGLSDTDAIGVLANVGRETGFNPRPGDGGTSDGYFQWHDDRMVGARAAGATGTDIRKAIDYAMSEPEGKAFLAQAGSFRTPAEAAQAWMTTFEKPASPGADQPINAQWASRVIQTVNGGRPSIDVAPGREDNTYPSEYEWIRAQAANDVLKQRDKLVSAGNQITAGANAGLFDLSQLNTPADFQERAKQSVVATGFVGAKDNKPFTPDEVAAFTNVMQAGTLDQKMQLLQNVAAMGSVAPSAYKQIGEKAPVFSAVGGLNAVSPTVAADVLRGVQAMQQNPDLKQDLGDFPTGPGPGGTPAIFNRLTGNTLARTPDFAYASRLAADALYVQREGAGAKWNADAYEQAVRDVLGAKPGDANGGLATINGQTAIMPPGVSGSEFTTMLHNLTPEDLTAHSVGGEPPHYTTGQVATPSDIAEAGKFQARAAGRYNIVMADGKPLLGSGTNGFYEFRINAAGVNDINSRPTEEPADRTGGMPDFMGSLENLFPKNFWRIPSRQEVHRALMLERADPSK